MKSTKFLSVILTLVIVIGMMPLPISAATDCDVYDNIIDITDKAVYERKGLGSAKAINIKITDADVESATEYNTTINIVLDGNTQPDATIDVEFGTALDRNMNMSGHKASVTLNEGAASVDMTLKGQYSSFGILSGTVTYSLNFSLGEISATHPTRKMECDSKTTYSGVAIDLNLKDYFEDAKEFYLVDGDEKTLIDTSTYTFKSLTGGTHTLVFSASNNIGECPDLVTVTIEITEIESGAWIGKTSSNGSLNYVLFTDADTNSIEELKVIVDENVINAVLPKSYPLNSSVKAKFDLTQNGDVPFITTKTGTSGTSSGKAVNNKFTEKSINLNAGSGVFTFYYYNSTPTTNNNNPEKWTLELSVANDLPVLSGGSYGEATVEANTPYELNLSPLFTDADGDSLTYFVSINGASGVAADASYSFTTDVAGTYTLVFTANDGKGTSTAAYTVTLTVENSTLTDLMTVCVPEDLSPQFFVCTSFEGGIDKQGAILEAVRGEPANNMTAYTVNYPVNARMLSVRDEGFGGMAFEAQKDGKVSLRKTQFEVVDYDSNTADSTNTITYGENTAVAGSDGWLIIAGGEYVFSATPKSAELAKAAKTVTVEAGADVYVAQMVLGISNPMSITVPKGAKAQLYKYNQYYNSTELDAKIITDNGDGTTTFQFVADTKNGTFIYRVSMDGKITKAGWTEWGKQNINVTYTENDKSPSYRLDDYSATGEANATIAEDSVLLNANRGNHLNLSVGETKTLKAYRAWEIIAKSYQNYIITPDFTYTVIQGDDVIKLTDTPSPSAADGDWMTLTALKEGVAIIEVTYNAIEIRGGSYDGVYGASDPRRTGLLVVQVGENDDTTVNFGIESFSSIGKSGSHNISYNPDSQKEWDSEFDTLYFTENSGKLTLKPTSSSDITEVSVSHDKGASWIVLNGENGTYNAEIVPGNNIIRVKTASGTAYQVVRGDKITVKLTEVSDKSDGDGIVESGETIRVTLIGLHNPIPKMAGNYNPGYGGNNDGYSSQHLNYTCNGVAIYGSGAQYNFITSANFVEVVMPDDKSSITLSDGYIGLGVIGLKDFTNGGDSHRNIPDGGCGTRGSETTYHTRSILPRITVFVGDTSAPNTAPLVRTDAITEGRIYKGQSFAINPDTLFADPDGDIMTFTVSANGAQAENAPVDYMFTPSGVGTYTLLFTATDGKEAVEHTVTLTVAQRPSQADSETKDDFGLNKSEIAGYVTISFTDKGVRVVGEKGLKFPKPLGTIISATKVPYKKGEKITHVTKRLLDHLGIRMEYTGTLEKDFYLGAICDFELKGTPYDTMGEFDAGTGSGWMITLNKKFIQYGASEFKVKNGDVIKWQYTCQLGKDIGDTFYSGPSNKNNKTEDKKKEETNDTKEEISKNTFTKTTFSDVKENDWHYEFVRYAYENNLMQGTGSGFEPESKMSRAMLVTVLYRMARPEKSENTHRFTDVPKDAWYRDAVVWAAKNNIVSGVSDNKFVPDEDITREQMALILYRYAKMQGFDVADASKLEGFTDAKDVSDWALDAMKWANSVALVNGTSDTTLSPKDTSTRAQVAAILMRFCENVCE